MNRRGAPRPEPKIAEQRHEYILHILAVDGRIRAVDIASDLGVTHETVRKDLVALQARGLLRRVHGGALPTEALSHEPAVADRTALTPEKRRIASAATQYVPAEGAVLLDAGSTTLALAESFPTEPRLTAFTNTLNVALALLAHPNLTVHTLGGRVRPTTMAEVDRWALRSLKEIHVDVAFLGTNGFSLTDGLATPNDAEAAVKAAMIECAQLRVLLADHTKLGRTAIFRYAELSAIDVLVTDTSLSAKDTREITRAGVEVVRV